MPEETAMPEAASTQEPSPDGNQSATRAPTQQGTKRKAQSNTLEHLVELAAKADRVLANEQAKRPKNSTSASSASSAAADGASDGQGNTRSNPAGTGTSQEAANLDAEDSNVEEVLRRVDDGGDGLNPIRNFLASLEGSGGGSGGGSGTNTMPGCGGTYLQMEPGDRKEQRRALALFLNKTMIGRECSANPEIRAEQREQIRQFHEECPGNRIDCSELAAAAGVTEPQVQQMLRAQLPTEVEREVVKKVTDYVQTSMDPTAVRVGSVRCRIMVKGKLMGTGNGTQVAAPAFLTMEKANDDRCWGVHTLTTDGTHRPVVEGFEGVHQSMTREKWWHILTTSPTAIVVYVKDAKSRFWYRATIVGGSLPRVTVEGVLKAISFDQQLDARQTASINRYLRSYRTKGDQTILKQIAEVAPEAYRRACRQLEDTFTLQLQFMGGIKKWFVHCRDYSKTWVVRQSVMTW